MSRILMSLALCVGAGLASLVSAREWADAEGRFLVRGEAFATNEDTVVVKKENGELVGIRIAELSDPDQDFLRQRELERQQREAE